MSVSYIVNGKVYTSYPLMDEIVYNCKLILNGIVVKNEYVAHLYETQETIDNQEVLFKCKEGRMTFETFPWTVEILMAFGYPRAVAVNYMNHIHDDLDATDICPFHWDFIDEDDESSGNPNIDTANYENRSITDYDFIDEDETYTEYILTHDYNFGDENGDVIPESDRPELLAFGVQYLLDHYVEKNKYYRSLMGLPEYETTKYDVYITAADLPDDFELARVDFTKPLHKQTSLVISALKSNGRLDEIIEQNRSFNYSYLRFLDDLALDDYNCRKAGKWEILYMPDANELVSSRFQEIYDINKQIYLKRTYQTAYAFRSDYYDHMLILLLLAQTFTDMISDAPEWFIRKDIFDIRTVQFFLEAYGIPFFEEIPLKYQIRIVKNLNKLIKYKSTEQNFEDIKNIFKLREVYVYRYYLYKKRRTDGQGHYVEDPDLNKMYELLFIDVILGDTYDNYIKNLNYRTPYDEVTLGDEYWDGTDDHDYVKQQVLQKEFTIEPTKYLTIKADINYLDYQRQLVYLLGMIVDTRVDVRELTLGVNSIYEGSSFRLSDLFIFMILLNNLEYDISQNIIRPEDFREGNDPLVSDPDDNWWMHEKYPEFFINYEDRVFGFNPEANLDNINKLLARNYTNSSLKTYTLADFGCDSFIVPTENIHSYEQLLDMYETNMECYKKLSDIITHSCMDKFQSLMAKYIFTQLFTKRYDYALAGLKVSLDDVLRDRDYILWSFYNNLTTSTDKESRNKDIESILNEIILSLEYYMDRDSLDYFFSFSSTASFTAITKYIYLMMDAFKSYKAHFIAPSIRYKFQYPDVMAGNYMEMNDTIMNRECSFSKFDKEYLHDKLNRILLKDVSDDVKPSIEILDIFNDYELLPEFEYIDGGTPDTSDYVRTIEGNDSEFTIPYITLDGGTPLNSTLIVGYQIDGKDESNLNLDDEDILELDGGNILYEEDDIIFNSPDNYFQKYFDRDYDGGTPFTNSIVNNNCFKRLYDYQDHQEMYVAARTGLEYTEDPETGTANLKEIWREWLSILEFESVNGNTELLEQLMNNNEFEEYYTEFLQKLEQHPEEINYTNELSQKYNINRPDISLSDIPAEENKHVPWDWDFGDEDDPYSGNLKLPVSNYEDIEIFDYDFVDEDIADEGQLHHDYNFGDVDYSRILWIENTYNYDTSRILQYNL